jgi:hypothetical protein
VDIVKRGESHFVTLQSFLLAVELLGKMQRTTGFSEVPSHSLSYLLGKWTFNFFVGFKVRRAERKVPTLFYKSLDLVLLLVLSFLCTEVVTLFQVWLRNKDSTCGNL